MVQIQGVNIVTASEVADMPPVSGEKSAKSGWIVLPAVTQMRSLDRKFECGNDGGKRSDKHDG